jgi:hypothetical protein
MLSRTFDQHALKEAKVFWFFFSKKNILSFCQRPAPELTPLQPRPSQGPRMDELRPLFPA